MTLNPEEYEIWIDKHLRGNLTEEEKIVFEHVLREDKTFHQRYSEMKEIHAGIRQSVLEKKWALLEMWDDDMTGDPDGMPEEIYAEHNTRLLIWLAIAAVIVLGAILMWPDGGR